MLKYLFLAVSFAAAVTGGAIGASTNDPVLMALGGCPGIVGILSLMIVYGSSDRV